jgi:hypothetical protein
MADKLTERVLSCVRARNVPSEARLRESSALRVDFID